MVGVEHWSEWVGGFSPFGLGTLVAAYEADWGITLNGANVASWAPRWVAPGSNVSALTWAQSTATAQPLFVSDRGDGRPELFFDGSTDTLECSGLAAAMPTATYAAALAGSCALTVNGRILNVGSGVGSESLLDILHPASGFNETWYIDAGGVMRLDVAVSSFSARRSHVWKRVTTQLTMRVASVESTTTIGSAASPPATKASVGSYFGALAKSACHVSALWFFGSNIDTLAVEQALRNRWPNYG